MELMHTWNQHGRWRHGTRIGHRTSAALVPQRSYFVFSMFFSLLITSVHPFPHPNASLLRAKTLDFAHYYIIALKASYQFFLFINFFQWKLTFWRSYCTKNMRDFLIQRTEQPNDDEILFHVRIIATFGQSSAAIWCNHSAWPRWSILRTWSNFACHSGAGGRQHPSASLFLFVYLPT